MDISDYISTIIPSNATPWQLFTSNPHAHEWLCEQVAQGISLASIARTREFTYSRLRTFFWSKPEDARTAQEARADFLVDEAISIADDRSEDWVMNRQGEMVFNGTHHARQRLQYDVRRWLAAKHHSRVYGDAVAVTGVGGGPIQTESKHTLSNEQLMQIAKGAV